MIFCRCFERREHRRRAGGSAHDDLAAIGFLVRENIKFGGVSRR